METWTTLTMINIGSFYLLYVLGVAVTASNRHGHGPDGCDRSYGPRGTV